MKRFQNSPNVLPIFRQGCSMTMKEKCTCLTLCCQMRDNLHARWLQHRAILLLMLGLREIQSVGLLDFRWASVSLRYAVRALHSTTSKLLNSSQVQACDFDYNQNSIFCQSFWWLVSSREAPSVVRTDWEGHLGKDWLKGPL